jgi:hypothetical protein
MSDSPYAATESRATRWAAALLIAVATGTCGGDRQTAEVVAGATLEATAPAVAASASSHVAGHWEGAISMMAPDGTSQSMPVTMELREENGQLTGTIGPSRNEQLPIASVSLTKGTLQLSAKRPSGTEMRFELTVAPDVLRGTVASGDEAPATIALRRKP